MTNETNKQNNELTENITNTEANIRQIRRISPFWLLPFIAFCIGAVLFFQIVQEQGKSITILFANGDGLVANKTQIQYQGLQIGTVKKVSFTDDLKQVEVEANIYPEAKTLLRKNTKFWLVKPTVSLAGVSGLESLVSGNYITLQPGDGDSEDEFVAEVEGPIAEVKDGDLLVRLLADDLGSISAGASVYYKKMPVGTVSDYRFTADQKKVEIDLIIEKAYANLVKKDSRFWNISGVDASLNAGGLNVKMDSLTSIIQGAVAFDSPEKSDIAMQGQRYLLYKDLKSAGRGLVINITLPSVLGLEVNKTPVFYKNTQVGMLSEINAENPYTEQAAKGQLVIDPNLASLLKTHSEIILNDKRPSLTEISSVEQLFRGTSFEIIAGDGEPRTEFAVIRQSERLLKEPNTLVLTLTSPDTYGVSAGQPIYYNGITIGEVMSQDITADKISFKAAIMSEYRNLINKDSKFIAASNFDVSVGVDGVQIGAANPRQWLQGGVRVLTKKSENPTALTSYPLYDNVENAEAGILADNINPTITLTATQLPSLERGSLVLYRQYEVGKILDIRPTSKNFQIDVFIYPKHRHLLTDKSLFWAESAAQVDITPKGINVQAGPLTRTLKGAISFDNSGNGNKILYPNELRAKSAGNEITLTAADAGNLSKGMTLRYMGLTIGEIEQINLDQANNRITAKALINPQYMNIVAKENSRFKVIAPQISAGAIENLDALLQPYIDVTAGNGARKTKFTLSQTAENPHRFNDGFPIIVETNDALNLTTGSPVLYRGVEVGTIRKMELNNLGDRVLIHLVILPKHQHLVRKNSEFWVASGYNFELGWKGAEFHTGSVQQLLKGGISFSNPTGTVVQPQAKANQRFLLRIKRPDEAPNWNQATMPN
ncbi:paraquat-inducible protein B [Cricetibacter osteomyelitidis]|uniref:Paraquat-inducible protein B n=1 Tax=Cricetibacter osteomyelitidis TaxID=1521931 RepID=A0A4R2SYF6_9PAST|nr:MlaD family protein [Cricetibacter osteomyelitidis]TCP93534.1 paraquat-inducible protein B [Cricetibacter osteomyelitidis]